MIVIKVEMWPGGLEAAKYDLVKATITNDGVATRINPNRANYKAALFDKTGKLWSGATVKDWPRKSKHVWRLVARLIQLAILNKDFN